MEYFVNDIIDGSSLTIDEYLEILLNGNYLKLYPNNCFPSTKMLDEFILKVKSISDKDIKRIIYRFIVKRGSYGTNNMHRAIIKNNKENLMNLYKIFPIYTKRLYCLGKPWEGLTWVLDLLPDYPKDVL